MTLDRQDIDAIAAAVAERVQRPAFFTAKSLAAYLDVSPRLVRQMLADGKIPSYTIEGSRRIAPEDVEAYLVGRRDHKVTRSAA